MRFLTSFGIALALVSTIQALYEDQVGLFDWRQRYVGNVNAALFEQNSHGRKIFVSTESNVVASINTRTGAILWRKVLEDSGTELLLDRSKSLITFSASTELVRSWDPANGNLLWEVSFKDEEQTSADPPVLLTKRSRLVEGESNGLLLLSSNGVHFLSPSDGAVIWEHFERQSDGKVYANVGMAVTSNAVVLFLLGEEYLRVRYLDIESGREIGEARTAKVPWQASAVIQCTQLSQSIVCAGDGSDIVHVLHYDMNSDPLHGIFQSISLATISIGAGNILPDIDGSNAFIVSSKDSNTLVDIVNDGSLQTLSTVPSNCMFSSSNYNDNTYFFSVCSSANSVQVNVFKDKDMQKLPKLATSFSVHQHRGNPVHIVAHMHQRKADFGFYLMVTFADHSVGLLQHIGSNEGKVLWLKEEALAQITNVEMVDLPPSTSHYMLELLHEEFKVVPGAGVFSMFLNRVRAQIGQLRSFVRMLYRAHQDEHYFSRDTDQSLKRDPFNTVKLMVVVTTVGKVFGMSSKTGAIVWSHYLAGISPFGDAYFLALQRSASHISLPPQMVLIGKQVRGRDVRASVFYFNPLSGKGLDSVALNTDYEVAQISELSFEDDDSVKVIAVIDTDHEVHIYPDSDEVRSKMLPRLSSHFVYLANTQANSVTGYTIHKSSDRFVLSEVWAVNVPEDQKIGQVSAKRGDEVVDSVGRVLGDHSVLYKYLNPNLIAFSTISVSAQKGSVGIYVVDGITGHVLYSVRHKAASEPVHFVLSENWLVYALYNPKARRVELSVTEFYEGHEEKNSTAFSSLEPSHAPMALSQSYIMHTSKIVAAHSTVTRRGITHRNLLFGLANGYVYSVPKNVLDPRRSYAHTPMLQEEGIPPYMPEFPVTPQAFVNYNLTLQAIKGIRTFSAGLESTCLVVVYGLDLYSTRVLPSKMFDVLKEDFDYALVSIVLSALTVISIVCARLASKRTLNMAWK